MRTLSQPRMYAGFASAAAVFLAVTVVFNMNSPVDTLTVPTEIVVDHNPEQAAHTDQAVIVNNSKALLDEIRKKPQPTVTAEVPEISAIAGGYAPSREEAAESRQVLSSNDAVARSAPLTMKRDDFVAPVEPAFVGRDRFEEFDANPVQRVAESPVSTFSIDVDTASYSFVRRQLNQGVLPQKAAVRLEEMVNYFPYDYPGPTSDEEPFRTTVSVSESPWNPENRLIHIGIKGYEIEKTSNVGTNLVFLLDVSGSMNQPDKLPLVKQSMSLLLGQLNPDDTVAMVVYAGAAGTVLEPTPVRERQKILAALNQLQAGGSTAGGAGIRLAYQLAESSFVEEGVNRVILATDGDFNVGITADGELEGFIERKRARGIYLSVLGFGQGNYQDALMQKLAQNGNGVAAYIDTLGEAQKVLVDEAQSMLFPIANDVKIQVEFNPATVSEYRLLGYETRALRREDFNNDKVDAGEIGAGHTVTAIYEITPVGTQGLIDAPRYAAENRVEGASEEYGFLKIRYKRPGETSSRLMSTVIGTALASNTESRFAIAVAGFAQLLKDGKYLGDWSFDQALELAIENKGNDPFGYRAELTQLIRKAKVADSL